MKAISLSLILSFTLLISCTNKPAAFSLKEDAVLNQFYNEEEIETLEQLVKYADDVMLKTTGQENVINAYRSYFDTIASKWDINRGWLDMAPPIEEIEKYAFLKSLHQDVIGSIWRFNTSYKSIYDKRRDTTYFDFTGITSLVEVMHGPFINLLKEIGKEKEYYQKHAEYIEKMGGIPASLDIYYPRNHKEFDYTQPADRLFAAIYVLSIEDNIYAKLDRYYEQEGIN